LIIANGSFAVQVNPEQIAGARYQPAQMADVDSER